MNAEFRLFKRRFTLSSVIHIHGVHVLWFYTVLHNSANLLIMFFIHLWRNTFIHKSFSVSKFKFFYYFITLVFSINFGTQNKYLFCSLIIISFKLHKYYTNPRILYLCTSQMHNMKIICEKTAFTELMYICKKPILHFTIDVFCPKKIPSNITSKFLFYNKNNLFYYYAIWCVNVLYFCVKNIYSANIYRLFVSVLT